MTALTQPFTPPVFRGRVVFVVCAALSLSACGSWNPSWNPLDWFGDDEPESPYADQEAPGGDQPYPTVDSVPERPTEGLIADVRDRLYEGEETAEGQEAEEIAPAPAVPEPTPAPRQPVIADAMPAETMPTDAVEEPPPPAPPSIDAAMDMPVNEPPPPPPVDSVMDMPMDEPPPAPPPVSAEAGALLPSAPNLAEDEFITPPADEEPTTSTTALSDPSRANVTIKMATLNFPFGSSFISSADRRHLREIISLAKEKNALLRVVGYSSSYTRNMPPLDHQIANFSVSLSRASAIANLVIASGFDSNRLSIEARSDSNPLFLEVMPAGRRGNQRAEIYMDY